MKNEYILTLSCPDRVGIVHAVSGFLAGQNCNINTSHQYGDPESKLFFMRVSFTSEQGTPDELQLLQRFEPIAQKFSIDWRMRRASARPRVLILVSKQGHCLHDLLYRTQTGELPMNIVGIASNHEQFNALANWHDIRYYYLPVTPTTKAEQEQSLKNIIEREQVSLVILARYMQILSPKLCDDLYGRCINIHHSFLPSFSGAQGHSVLDKI